MSRAPRPSSRRRRPTHDRPSGGSVPSRPPVWVAWHVGALAGVRASPSSAGPRDSGAARHGAPGGAVGRPGSTAPPRRWRFAPTLPISPPPDGRRGAPPRRGTPDAAPSRVAAGADGGGGGRDVHRPRVGRRDAAAHCMTRRSVGTPRVTRASVGRRATAAGRHPVAPRVVVPPPRVDRGHAGPPSVSCGPAGAPPRFGRHAGGARAVGWPAAAR